MGEDPGRRVRGLRGGFIRSTPRPARAPSGWWTLRGSALTASTVTVLQWQEVGRQGRQHQPPSIDKFLDIEANGPISLRVFVGGSRRTRPTPATPCPRSPCSAGAGVGLEPPGRACATSSPSTRQPDFDYTVHFTVRYLDPLRCPRSHPGTGMLFSVPRYSGLWESRHEPRTEWSIGLTGAEVNAQASETLRGRTPVASAQLQPYALGGTVSPGTTRSGTFGGGGQLWNLDCDETHFRKTTDENWNLGPPGVGGPPVRRQRPGPVRGPCGTPASTDRSGTRTPNRRRVPRATTGDTWSWAPPTPGPCRSSSTVKCAYSCLWNKGQHRQAWHPNCSDAEARKIGG